MSLGWSGPVDGSSREFTDSSVTGRCLVTERESKDRLAADGYPFIENVTVHQMRTCAWVGVDSTHSEVDETAFVVSGWSFVRSRKAESASWATLGHPFVIYGTSDGMSSRCW